VQLVCARSSGEFHIPRSVCFGAGLSALRYECKYESECEYVTEVHVCSKTNWCWKTHDMRFIAAKMIAVSVKDGDVITLALSLGARLAPVMLKRGLIVLSNWHV